MSKKRHRSHLKKSLAAFAAAVLLIALCALITFIIVWPLWKFAVTAPAAYTRIVLALLCAALVFFVITRIRKNAK